MPKHTISIPQQKGDGAHPIPEGRGLRAEEKVNEGSPFTFVTDGLESALAQAQAVAGEKAVAVASTTIAQQCLKAGLLDEIHIDLVPVLLGEGIRLFDHLGANTILLEIVSVEPDRGVTHLTYRVVK